MERHAIDYVKTLRKGTLGHHVSSPFKKQKGNLNEVLRYLETVWDFLLL